MGQKNKTVKEYDTDQYLQYLDTVKQKAKEIYDQFVVQYQPDSESEKWALLFSENDYYQNIVFYASDHRIANNMDWNNDWNVPKGFYDKLCSRLPIESDMFISAYALNNFSSGFKKYVFDNLRGQEVKDIDDESGEVYYTWTILPGGGVLAPESLIDSIKIFSTIEFVQDTLLRQMMLTEIFDEHFNKQNIKIFEQYRNVIDTYIKEPFMKEPLLQKYCQTKSRIEAPQVYTSAILKELTDLSVNQIVEEILEQNKNKVIYVDFWATWCAPCLLEMPNSKALENELNDKDVAFIYICLESNEEQWKATLDKFKLGGQHYLLSKKQSGEIRTLLDLTGIPFYLLIDKNGVFKEKGSHLRPIPVKGKIEELLK